MERFESVKATEKYYQEQLESQRGMLSSAIENLVLKKNELEEALQLVQHRNKELNLISSRTFHDMREPMIALFGLVKMLRDESDSDSMKYLLDLTESSVKRLDNFSLSLSDYVQIMQKEFLYEQIDFNSFFKLLLESLASVDGREKVTIDWCQQCLSGLPFHYDTEKLSTMLRNIISNSIRYRDVEKTEQKVRIVVKVKKDRTIIMVRDNGMGISNKSLHKVTDMFYRGTNKSQGVGLGLYVVKTLLDETKGDLRIRSTEDVGTAIIIILPNQNQNN